MSIAMFGTLDDDDADIEDKDFEGDKGHEDGDGDDEVDEDDDDNENEEGGINGDAKDENEGEDLIKKDNDHVVNNLSNKIVSDDNRRVLMDEKSPLMTVTHIDDTTTDAVDDIVI